MFVNFKQKETVQKSALKMLFKLQKIDNEGTEGGKTFEEATIDVKSKVPDGEDSQKETVSLCFV